MAGESERKAAESRREVAEAKRERAERSREDSEWGRRATEGDRASADDERIDVEKEQDVRYWADKFGVTAEEIRSAVRAAGPMVKDVRQRLAANRSY